MLNYQMRLLMGQWYLCLSTGEPIVALTVDTLTPEQTAVQYLTEAGVVDPRVTTVIG